MTVYPRAIGAFTALIAATTAFSAPADARRKEPAPIVYAGQGDRAAAPASAARGDTPRIVRRTLEFRYPDQPDTPIYKDIPVDSRDYASAAVAPRAAAPAPAVRQAAFQPAADPAYDEQGVASWYGDGFEGRPTANGEIFEASAMTAAHPTLPLPSLVHVVNLDNGREVVVRVNDRGPFEDLAVRGRTALKTIAIPRRHALLVISRICGGLECRLADRR
ncbi:MAG: septal ring lytic transglycosylase RlpA family protein, partial [Pseudomonadota bacterium]